MDISIWYQCKNYTLCHGLITASIFQATQNSWTAWGPPTPFVILSWIPWKSSFRYVHCTGQFTPKMKANAEPRLLSSLVRIDSSVVVSQHRLESFFHEIKCSGMTSFMEFLFCTLAYLSIMTTDIRTGPFGVGVIFDFTMPQWHWSFHVVTTCQKTEYKL